MTLPTTFLKYHHFANSKMLPVMKRTVVSLHLALHLPNSLEFLQKLISFPAEYLLLILKIPYRFFPFLGFFCFYHLERKKNTKVTFGTQLLLKAVSKSEGFYTKP